MDAGRRWSSTPPPAGTRRRPSFAPFARSYFDERLRELPLLRDPLEELRLERRPFEDFVPDERVDDLVPDFVPRPEDPLPLDARPPRAPAALTVIRPPVFVRELELPPDPRPLEDARLRVDELPLRDVPDVLRPREVPEVLPPRVVPEVLRPRDVPDVLRARVVPDEARLRVVPDVLRPREVPEVLRPRVVPDVLRPRVVPEVPRPRVVPDVLRARGGPHAARLARDPYV